MIDLSSIVQVQRDLSKALAKFSNYAGDISRVMGTEPSANIYDDYSASYGMNALIKYAQDGTPTDVTDASRSNDAKGAIVRELTRFESLKQVITQLNSDLPVAIDMNSGSAEYAVLNDCCFQFEDDDLQQDFPLFEHKPVGIGFCFKFIDSGKTFYVKPISFVLRGHHYNGCAFKGPNHADIDIFSVYLNRDEASDCTAAVGGVGTERLAPTPDSLDTVLRRTYNLPQSFSIYTTQFQIHIDGYPVSEISGTIRSRTNPIPDDVRDGVNSYVSALQNL